MGALLREAHPHQTLRVDPVRGEDLTRRPSPDTVPIEDEPARRYPRCARAFSNATSPAAVSKSPASSANVSVARRACSNPVPIVVPCVVPATSEPPRGPPSATADGLGSGSSRTISHPVGPANPVSNPSPRTEDSSGNRWLFREVRFALGLILGPAVRDDGFFDHHQNTRLLPDEDGR